MNDDNGLIWLALALASTGFILWHQSTVNGLEKQLNNCQTRFESFKDGVTYGR